MNDLNDQVNTVITAYSEEVKHILKGDKRLLDVIDMLFLVSVELEKQGDTIEPITDDFIDGFCVGLFHSGKIDDGLQTERLKSLIKSARALILLR